MTPSAPQPDRAGKRVALVTGASSAIGQAASAALVDAGYRVLAVGRDDKRLARAAAQRPGAVVPIIADLCEDTARDRVMASVTDEGRLDLLVLGSGIYGRSNAPDALGRQFAANVQAPFALLNACRELLAAARGQVVFINSTQGLAASPGIGSYAATQHALRAIADSFRDEVNAEGVRVGSIFLGRTATDRQAGIFAMEGRRYQPERLIQPTDVAELIVALIRLPRTAEVTNVTLRPMLKP